MATLTRDEMEKVIRDGGSVLHRNRVIARLEDLPSEADLARQSGTDEDRAAAKRALQERAQALLDEAAALDAAPAAPKAEPPKVGDAPRPPLDAPADPKAPIKGK